MTKNEFISLRRGDAITNQDKELFIVRVPILVQDPTDSQTIFAYKQDDDTLEIDIMVANHNLWSKTGQQFDVITDEKINL